MAGQPGDASFDRDWRRVKEIAEIMFGTRGDGTKKAVTATEHQAALERIAALEKRIAALEGRTG